MAYQIDQSGKIEYTSHDTVLAISNGNSFTVMLKASEKRLLSKMYQVSFNKKRQYVYEVFSALVSILITAVKANSLILIDKEYPGQESLIKLRILQYTQAAQPNLPEDIDFGLVGKKSSAHNLAYATFKRQRKADLVITAEEVIAIIFPQKKTGYSSISGTEGS